MSISYLPLIGDGTTGGAGGPLAGISIISGAAIPRESVPGVAGVGRPGYLRTSLLLLMTAFTTDNNAGQRLILDIPSSILAAPAALAAINAGNPYDYSELIPMCSAQLIAAGASVSFPTSELSFTFGSAIPNTAAIFPTIGVTGLVSPTPTTQYGQIQVDFFANSGLGGITGAADPTMAMFQLTVDWGASQAN